MATIIDVLNALRSQVVTFRTLPPQHIATENIHVGNHAVVCRCVARDSGEEIALKCYPRRRRNVPEIYGMAYKPNEVGVFTLNAPLEYVDAVAMPWIDGLSLEKHFHNPNSDYRALSYAFDSMARSILLSPRAHGDIKPANIIIAPSGEMHLIDFDAAWMPGFTDRDIEVVGTAAFGHPMRLGRRFDAYIDDFPIALIVPCLLQWRIGVIASSRILEVITHSLIHGMCSGVRMSCSMLHLLSSSVSATRHTTMLPARYMVVRVVLMVLPMLLARRGDFRDLLHG